MYAVQILLLICFAVSSAVFMVITYVQSHLLLGLDKVLDCWCGELVDCPDFIEGASSWNAMQALLKCVGRELAGSFVALQAVGAVGFAFFLGGSVSFAFRTDVEPVALLAEILASVPLPVLFILNMRVCAHGAALTESLGRFNVDNIDPFVSTARGAVRATTCLQGNVVPYQLSSINSNPTCRTISTVSTW